MILLKQAEAHHQCPERVTGGKTLSEYMFSELLQMADIVGGAGGPRTALDRPSVLRVSAGHDPSSHTQPQSLRYEFAEDEWIAIRPWLPTKPYGVPRVDNRRIPGSRNSTKIAVAKRGFLPASTLVSRRSTTPNNGMEPTSSSSSSRAGADGDGSLHLQW